MHEGAIEDHHNVENLPRVELPDVSESLEPMSDSAGSAAQEMSDALEIQTKAMVEADAVRADLLRDSAAEPQETVARTLTLERDALNMQIRERRLECKRADTWAAKIFPAARQHLASLEASVGVMIGQRDDIERHLDAMLPKEAGSMSMQSPVTVSREKIGNVLGTAIAGMPKYKEHIPQKDVLRADRMNLANELSTLKFWQFGRKQKIASAIREIDQNMAAIIKAERNQ